MASEDRGKVVKVPMRERDWSLLLGTLHVLARGIDQSGDPDVRVAVKEALVRAGKLAHALRVRRTMPADGHELPGVRRGRRVPALRGPRRRLRVRRRRVPGVRRDGGGRWIGSATCATGRARGSGSTTSRGTA